jgi:ethanolamine utilization protein EutS
LFKKLGLPDSVSAIGILTITPSEASIIACDIATKSGAVELFLDRFTGAVVLTGDVSAVEYAETGNPNAGRNDAFYRVSHHPDVIS